jgi:hypothetical protein
MAQKTMNFNAYIEMTGMADTGRVTPLAPTTPFREAADEGAVTDISDPTSEVDYEQLFMAFIRVGDQEAKERIARSEGLNYFPEIVLTLSQDRDPTIRNAVPRETVAQAIVDVIRKKNKVLIGEILLRSSPEAGLTDPNTADVETSRKENIALIGEALLEKFPEAILELTNDADPEVRDALPQDLVKSVFTQIADGQDTEAKIKLIENKSLGKFANILLTLAKDKDPKVRQAVAGSDILAHHKHVTFHIAKYEKNTDVLLVLAGNKALANCSPATVALANRKDVQWRVHDILANNGRVLKESSQATLKLAKHPDLHVRETLATNSVALSQWPDATLILAKDPESSVRKKLISDSRFALERCPLAVIFLADDPDPEVRDMVSKPLLKEAITVIANGHDQAAKIALAQSKVVERFDNIVFKLAKDPDPDVSNALAPSVLEQAFINIANSNDTEAKVLLGKSGLVERFNAVVSILLDDPDPAISNALPETARERASAISIANGNDTTAKENLAKDNKLKDFPEATLVLARDTNWRVRRVLASNGPALAANSEATLLLADARIEKEVHVRQALAANGEALAANEEATLLLATDPDQYVRGLVSKNTAALKAHPIAIIMLMDHPVEDVRNAMKKALDEEAILKIARDPNPERASHIAGNFQILMENIPVIYELKEHPDQAVRQMLVECLTSTAAESHASIKHGAGFLTKLRNLTREIRREVDAAREKNGFDLKNGPT